MQKIEHFILQKSYQDEKAIITKYSRHVVLLPQVEVLFIEFFNENRKYFQGTNSEGLFLKLVIESDITAEIHEINFKRGTVIFVSELSKDDCSKFLASLKDGNMFVVNPECKETAKSLDELFIQIPNVDFIEMDDENKDVVEMVEKQQTIEKTDSKFGKRFKLLIENIGPLCKIAKQNKMNYHDIALKPRVYPEYTEKCKEIGDSIKDELNFEKDELKKMVKALGYKQGDISNTMKPLITLTKNEYMKNKYGNVLKKLGNDRYKLKHASMIIQSLK